MVAQNQFFEDLAKVTSGAFSAASGMREEIERIMRDQCERFMARMNLVPREEFEVVREVAVAARNAQEELEVKVAEFENRLAALEKTLGNSSIAVDSKLR